LVPAEFDRESGSGYMEGATDYPTFNTRQIIHIGGGFIHLLLVML
jgi:hypothetical protein